MDTLWQWRNAHGQQQHSYGLWHSTEDWLIELIVKKSFPTALHYLDHLGLFKKGRLGSWIRAFGIQFSRNSAEIKFFQTRLHFSSLKMSSLGKSSPTAASAVCPWLTVVELNVVFCCCSPTTSRLTYCASWDAFLLNTFVQNGYPSYHSFVNLNLHGLSSLTFSHYAFLAAELHPLDAVFKCTILSRFLRMLCENPRYQLF